MITKEIFIIIFYFKFELIEFHKFYIYFIKITLQQVQSPF
jgi:hypothetical protein